MEHRGWWGKALEKSGPPQIFSSWLNRFSGNDEVSFRHPQCKVERVCFSRWRCYIDNWTFNLECWSAIWAEDIPLGVHSLQLTIEILDELIQREGGRPSWEPMRARILRERETLAEHGEGITRYIRGSLGEKDVIYVSGKRFLWFCAFNKFAISLWLTYFVSENGIIISIALHIVRIIVIINAFICYKACSMKIINEYFFCFQCWLNYE